MLDFNNESDFPVDLPLNFFFHVIYRIQRTYATSIVKQYDMNFSQSTVLLKLLDKENISQSEICEMLNEDRGALARTLNGLEDKGFIIRKKDPGNRRKNKIFLTSEGKDFAINFRKKMCEREKEIIKEIPIDILEFKKILKNITIKSVEFNEENIGGK